MYIRRKVFSLLNVEGEDRYFSTTEFSLTENGEARLFAEKEEPKKEKKSLGKKVAIGAGVAAGTAAAAIGASKGAGVVMRNSGKKALEKLANNKNVKFGSEEYKKLEEVAKNRMKRGAKLEKPADAIVEGAKGAVEGIKRGSKKAVEKVEEAGKTLVKKVKKAPKVETKEIVKK